MAAPAGGAPRPTRMYERSISPEDLDRLRDERKAADRRYNEALTALDAALQQLRDAPRAPPAYDERQIPRLNALCDPLAPAPGGEGGWRGRLRAIARRAAAPTLRRQQAFNAALVDHVNRNAETHREVAHAVAGAIALVREELERLVHFQHRLIQFAQQITPYVDTKDREAQGVLRRLAEEVAGIAAGVSGGVSGFSDEMQKRWESLASRMQRSEARIEELRGAAAAWREAAAALEREVVRLRERPADGQAGGGRATAADADRTPPRSD